MHPELSLVILTVLAGAGQGVFMLVVILDLFFHGAGNIPSEYILASGIISVALQLIGVAASTLHLGNPSRGWKAAFMLKNSWLSREVISLSLSVGFAIAYILLYYTGASYAMRLTVGVAGIVSGISFYIASSMVYASVKFIREWANIYTPLNFIFFGLTSGVAINYAVVCITGLERSIVSSINIALILLGSVSLIMKSLAFRFNANAYVSVNIKNALGTNDPEINLMDMGTPYAHYNTKEYFYPHSRQETVMQIALVLTLSFIIPLLLWLFIALNPLGQFNTLLSIAAAIFFISGLIIERRLFFIQGNNLQNLYYNNFRRADVRNPLLSKARKGTPLPQR